jgi:hypothetical protein
MSQSQQRAAGGALGPWPGIGLPARKAAPAAPDGLPTTKTIRKTKPRGWGPGLHVLAGKIDQRGASVGGLSDSPNSHSPFLFQLKANFRIMGAARED